MGKHRIFAVVKDKVGNVLSYAENNYTKTHPIQAKFAEGVNQPTRIFLHAEIAALVKLHHNAKPFSLEVSRYYKDGTPANARPCPVCEAAIKHYGIKRVSYTL